MVGIGRNENNSLIGGNNSVLKVFIGLQGIPLLGNFFYCKTPNFSLNFYFFFLLLPPNNY